MIGNDWDIVLKEEMGKDYFQELIAKVKQEYQHHTVTESKGRVKIFKRSFAIHGGKNKK